MHPNASTGSLPEGAFPRSVRYKLEPEHLEDENTFQILTTIKHFATLLLVLLTICGEIITILILYVIIRPFSRPAYRRLSCATCGGFFDAIALLLPNMKICLTGDSDHLSPVGVSVLLCNHSMEGDWWAMIMLARILGLKGSVKAFLQKTSLNVLRTENSSSINMSASLPILSMIGVSSNGNNLSIDMTRALSRPNCALPASDPKSILEPSLITIFLNKFLDYPLLSSANNHNYIHDRNELFSLLRTFAADSFMMVPTHLLLFPEGMLLEGQDRKSMIAKSLEFAKREGRPQLKHLLLPRTTGFSASLDSLRESSPVVYDCCIAYKGYDGQTFIYQNMSFHSLFHLIQNKIPNEVHIRIKRYSMEEVMSDSTWLDKKWAEKDQLLEHFSRHGSFPVDRRGFSKQIVMNTKWFHVENSISALFKLVLIPFISPIILIFTVPVLFAVAWFWLLRQLAFVFLPDIFVDSNGPTVSDGPENTKGSNVVSRDSTSGTPFFPATPFASPINIQTWASTTSTNDSNKKMS